MILLTRRVKGLLARLIAGAVVLILFIANGVFAVSASEPSPVPADFGEGHRVGQIGDPLLLECSGIDASTRRSDVLWAINDEGEGLYLFALGLDGRARGRVLVRDAQNRDCEALDAFRWKGESFLLIADTGNNRGRRRSLVLYVVREPTLAAERFDGSTVVDVAWRIVFQYPGQPRDAEAVAVDVSTGSVLVVTKREFRPLLFVLPLNPPPGQPVVAREVGEVGQMPLRFSADPLSQYARNATRPTALDISPSGDSAVLLTYRDAYLFSRLAGQRWEDILRTTGRPILLPSPDDTLDLRTRESACFGADGRRIFVTTEGKRAGLYEMERK